MYSKYFSTTIVTIYQEPCVYFITLFAPTNKIVLMFVEKKPKKIENVSKQFVNSQNILKYRS